jgi:hypothetical protein
VAASWQFRHYLDTIESYAVRQPRDGSKIPEYQLPTGTATSSDRCPHGGSKIQCIKQNLSTAAGRRNACACLRSNALIRRYVIKSKPWRRTGPTRLWLERIGERFTHSFWHKVEHRAPELAPFATRHVKARRRRVDEIPPQLEARRGICLTESAILSWPRPSAERTPSAKTASCWRHRYARARIARGQAGFSQSRGIRKTSPLGSDP